jgi:hypothetical protein
MDKPPAPSFISEGRAKYSTGEYAKDHFHAYALMYGLNYRASCCETWMGAIVALRQMGAIGYPVPTEPADHWVGPDSDNGHPAAVISRQPGDYDTCEGDHP